MCKLVWLWCDVFGIDEIYVYEFVDNVVFSCEYGDCFDEEDGVID